MKQNSLLEQIWSEAIELRQPGQMSPLAGLLGTLLTVPTVTLVSHGGAERPFAMMEGAELLPGASLGDILAEELGIDVPRDAVVLIEPAAFADAEEFSGSELGQKLGNVLMDIASCVTGPLIHADRHRETPDYSRIAGRQPGTREYGQVAAEFGTALRQDVLRAQ